MMEEEKDQLTITIVYDNNTYDPGLTTDWGFAAVVTYGGHTLLFDTGADGNTLLGNMRALGIEPGNIQYVVLSHEHRDHVGGLQSLLASGVKPDVLLLSSFPEDFKRQTREGTAVFETTPGSSVTDHIYVTGEIPGDIPEQALVIDTGLGLVVITGCAHPGIVQIIERTQELFDKQVYLVLGGFHLRSKSEAEITSILRDLRRLEVQKVAPCHCTGEQAIAMFADEYKDDFIQAGVGCKVIVSSVPTPEP